MKTIFVLSFSILVMNSYSQELGSFQLQDYLSSTMNSECPVFDNRYIIGPPDDSIWVNTLSGSNFEGSFNYSWIDGSGDDLLIETGYHESIYDVRLVLADSSFSSTYNVTENDWILLTDSFVWNSASLLSCVENEIMYVGSHHIAPLDFGENFGLQASDIVIGIEINFLPTTGIPDLAGIYITEFALTCDQVSLEEDMTICSNETLLIDAGNYNSYLWNDQTTDSTLFIDGLVVGLGVHTYSVQVVDDHGCYSQDSINITVELCSNIKKIVESSKILVYPSPANDFLTLSIKDEMFIGEVEIFTYNGKLINKFAFSNSNINITDYPKGMYFGRIRGKGYFKFIKE